MSLHMAAKSAGRLVAGVSPGYVRIGLRRWDTGLPDAGLTFFLAFRNTVDAFALAPAGAVSPEYVAHGSLL